MRQGRWIAAFVLCLQSGTALAEVAVAVSPGGADRSAEIESRCPTFSWGARSGATSFELAVFEVDESVGSELTAESLADSARLALWSEVPGAALSWTPSATDCLERGRRYAWFVRGVAPPETGPWSAPLLFEVQEAPTVGEVEAALETLRRYIGRDGARPLPSALSALTAESLEPDDLARSLAAPEPAGPTDPEIGLDGVVSSTVAGSIGVRGRATAATGVVDGVRGVTDSTQGSGVRGIACPISGVNAGVSGFAFSPLGFGGVFVSGGFGNPGGTGLYSSGASNTSADLVLGGNFFFPTLDDDDGRITSDPIFPSSDLFLTSNDDVEIALDADGGGEDADFTVTDKDGVALLNIDATSKLTFIEGDLFLNGNPQGGLLSIPEVEQMIASALDDHLSAEHYKLVFVTSTTYNGDLNGLAGADARCNQRADAAGLFGTFKAWISGNSASEEARDRMNQSSAAYRRVDYVKVADNWDDLVDGTLDAAIRIDENGLVVGEPLTAYTNTNADGSIRSGSENRPCENGSNQEWESADPFESGSYGTVSATTSSWSFTNNNACNVQRRLYCIQQ